LVRIGSATRLSISLLFSDDRGMILSVHYRTACHLLGALAVGVRQGASKDAELLVLTTGKMADKVAWLRKESRCPSATSW
jgi:hypothetical protein